MKNFTLSFLIITFCFSFSTIYCQDSTKISKIVPVDLNLKTEVDSLKMSDAYMKYCFTKFYKVHSTGTALIVIGGIVAGVASFEYQNNEDLKYVIFAGAGLSFIGWIVEEVSFKWMKKAGLSLADQGVGIKVNLH